MNWTSYKKDGVGFFIPEENGSEYVLVEIRNKKLVVDSILLDQEVEVKFQPSCRYDPDTRMLTVKSIRVIKAVKMFEILKATKPEMSKEELDSLCITACEADDDECEVALSAKDGKISIDKNRENGKIEIIYE